MGYDDRSQIRIKFSTGTTAIKRPPSAISGIFSSLFLFISIVLPCTAVPSNDGPTTGSNTTSLLRRHFRTLIDQGTDAYGPEKTPMWMSMIDTETGRPVRKPENPGRTYRKIWAPRGTTLYWDQPLLVAACELSRLTGEPAYKDAAERYIRSFLDCCVDKQGMFRSDPHDALYRSVDGVGHLFLALLSLETEQWLNLRGSGF